MKKLFALLFTFSFILSVHAQFVTFEEAKTVAMNFMATHQLASQQSDTTSIKLQVTARQRARRTAGKKPCYYIFNSADDKGFVIVSAESTMPQILAYSTEGSFHEEDADKGAEVFLNQYEQEVELMRSQSLTTTLQAKARKVASVSGDSVLLKTANLNQTDGYWFDRYCPLNNDKGAAPCGCAATAGTIIMHYHQWPSQGVGQHSYTSRSLNLALSRDFSKDTYDWSCIPFEPYSSGTWSEKAKDEAPKALLACGIACNMDYYYGASSASIESLGLALRDYFKYSASYNLLYINSENGLDKCKTSIDQGMPVVVASYDLLGAGHLFVMDGYCGDYYHFNFGWGGYNNAWFLNGRCYVGEDGPYGINAMITNLHPQDGTILEQGTYSDISYKIDDYGILTLSGEGSVPRAVLFTTKAFYGVDVQEGITALESSAFYNRPITEIKLPSTLASIGKHAFALTSSLTKMTCAAMYPPTMEEGVFEREQPFTSTDTLYVPFDAIQRYKDADQWNLWPNIVAIPGSETWENPSQVEVTLASAGTLSVKLPETDRSIIRELIINGPINGDDIKLLRELTNSETGTLTILNLSKAHIATGGGAYIETYYGDFYVEENDVIPYCMFYGCNKLSTLILPETTIAIDVDAIPVSVHSISLPAGLKRIYSYAFEDCEVDALTIPASVDSIGDCAFFHCYKLKKLEVDPANPYYKSENNTIYTADGKTLVVSCNDDEIFSVPLGVENIRQYAFYSNHTEIILPSTLKSIDDYGVHHHLETIYCFALTPPSLRSNSIYADTVYVPAGTKSLYASASRWKYFSNIIEFEQTDVNGDGSVDSQDVLKIYDIMKKSSLDTTGDVNSDGQIDSQDVLKIYDYMKNH